MIQMTRTTMMMTMMITRRTMTHMAQTITTARIITTKLETGFLKVDKDSNRVAGVEVEISTTMMTMTMMITIMDTTNHPITMIEMMMMMTKMTMKTKMTMMMSSLSLLKIALEKKKKTLLKTCLTSFISSMDLSSKPRPLSKIQLIDLIPQKN